ncbi:hypothetical protein [Photobacterium angustum]|uniref:Uncharacterized protein n=1 Tax=Photobacterium angustum (strain S14 / CCUG 15956) TaxID=314292 RepID=Q1ZVY0_PHOAS|nr:hypothetical protein [Photobacterium angustum]EAS65930.1 hypothetical protein VAS14_11474 [Photobacterium angustum S14]KJF93817.1 hypothetical protein UB39_13890 [Photobacterium angustum]KJG03008.1 hypothetical protein UB35_04745 [Photobacterium angustum]KJG08097.1 hypothetical protein UB33_00565 [Photobacterium angustum]KJG17805.1 hypothetical protein UA33_07510 [Photobacterium angustum]
MKNLLTGFVAVVIGLFTISFAAIMALLMGVVALIAKPFIKRKLASEGVQFEERTFSEGFAGRDRKVDTDYRQQSAHTVIDGEFEDVTMRKC